MEERGEGETGEGGEGQREVGKREDRKNQADGRDRGKDRKAISDTDTDIESTQSRQKKGF